MLKKAFLTIILLVGTLLPKATYAHDALLALSLTSKVLLMPSTDRQACIERNAHTFPAPQLQTHKPQQLLYAKPQSPVFKTFEANLIKLQSIDSLEREVLNALRPGIFLSTRFQRAPPTQTYNSL